MTLLHTYTSDIEQVSIDECYLFYTPISYRFPSPEAAARQIADAVRNTLGFTVNVGIAENKLLAKMASDFEKPDRVHTLYRDEIPVKMWPLSVHELFMVGRKSASRLEELGIHTIGELAHSDRTFLQTHFKSHGILMWEYANGIDHSAVHSDTTKAKCIGNSTTLASDVTTRSEAFEVLLSLSEEVAARLRKAGQLASTVTVEVKYSDFHTASRQMQTLSPIATTDALYDCACQLFNALWNGSPIRLLGVRTSRLQSEQDPIQLSLFDLNFSLAEASPSDVPSSFGLPAKKPDLDKQRKLDAAMDQIRQRFGKDAIMRGSHLARPASRTDPPDS